MAANLQGMQIKANQLTCPDMHIVPLWYGTHKTNLPIKFGARINCRQRERKVTYNAIQLEQNRTKGYEEFQFQNSWQIIANVCEHISFHIPLEKCKFTRSTREEKFLNFLL